VDLRRPRLGEWIAGVASALGLVSLFLPWYEIGGSSASGWESLAVVDVILLVAAAAGITLLLAALVHPTPGLPMAVSALTVLVAIVAVIAVAVRVIDPPDPATTREAGAYLGLLATVALLAGTFLSMWSERPARTQRRPEVRGVGAPDPATGPTPS
jgi:hypothetical protein